MTSRPQFSLRLLLLVMLIVCLAAATLHRAPPKDWNGGDQEWEELGRAVHVQSWLRLAACVVFPAAIIAAAAARGGYSRAFCLGALLPVALPLVLMAYALGDRGVLLPGNVGYMSVISHMLSERIAALWLCAPCVGFVCVVVRWFLPTPRQWDTVARRKFLVRASLIAAVAACAWWAIVALPSTATQNNLAWGVIQRVLPHPSVLRQLPLRMLLCLALPAVLGIGAVEGRGVVRVFCACGLLPALVPAMLVSGMDIVISPIDGRWESVAMFHWRYSIFTMWGLVPCFGLTAACFYWLFHRGEADERNGNV